MVVSAASKHNYGDTPIEKEECVNHIAKRLGSPQAFNGDQEEDCHLGCLDQGKLTVASTENPLPVTERPSSKQRKPQRQD